MVWVRADPDNSAHKVNPRLAVSRIHLNLPEAACCLLPAAMQLGYWCAAGCCAAVL
jgi:hypothetical protein|eukprot:COSAG06_NODE_228_length_19725_cov_8.167839_15_plen_56_part_00